MKEKTIYLNRLRVIASLLVVIIHVSALFFSAYSIDNKAWVISTFYNCLSRIAVPLFIMVSGAIYLNENKQITFKKIFSAIFRFTVMFFIWDIFYLCFDYFIIKKGSINSEIFYYLFNSLTKYKYHLWYLLDYIVLLAFTPIIRLICKKENRKQVKYLLLLFLIGTCIVCFLQNLTILFNNSIFLIKEIKQIFSILELINFGKITNLFILFISGWYFSTFDFENRKKLVCILKWTIGIIAPILTILLCFATSKNGFYLLSYYYYLPNYILSICVFLTFRYSKIANSQNKFFETISDNSLGIYVTHAFVIDLIYTFILPYFSTYLNSLWMMIIIPIFVISAYVISLLISMILNLLPKKIKKWIC